VRHYVHFDLQQTTGNRIYKHLSNNYLQRMPKRMQNTHFFKQKLLWSLKCSMH